MDTASDVVIQVMMVDKSRFVVLCFWVFSYEAKNKEQGTLNLHSGKIRNLEN